MSTTKTTSKIEALYHAHHEIVPLRKNALPPVTADVVGPICESGDFLARGRTALHPQLVHFLENRSYAKAVMFLGGETDIPVGACGGRASRPAKGAEA